MFLLNVVRGSYLRSSAGMKPLPCHLILTATVIRNVILTVMCNDDIEANVSCHRVTVDVFITCAPYRLQKMHLLTYLIGINTGLPDEIRL